MLANQYQNVIMDKKERQNSQKAFDKQEFNSNVQLVQNKGEEREQTEAAKQKIITENCKKEWNMRLKAKEFIRRIRQNNSPNKQMVREPTNTGSILKNYNYEQEKSRIGI